MSRDLICRDCGRPFRAGGLKGVAPARCPGCRDAHTKALQRDRARARSAGRAAKRGAS